MEVLTLEKISDITGFSKVTVYKKLLKYNIGNTTADSTGGRPQKLYRLSDIAQIFNLNLTAPPSDAAQYAGERSLRSDRGLSRKGDISLEKKIVAEIKEMYLSQGKIENVYLCAQWVCIKYDRDQKFEHYPNPYDAADYYYFSRIMRNDGGYKGYYYKDNWKGQWKDLWQKGQHNNMLPINRWDWISILTEAGMIGEGFGAGDFRVIDATKFDAWTRKDGKSSMFWYYQMLCPITGFPMLVAPMASETIQRLIGLVAESYRRYGAPAYAWIIDNSKVNISGISKNFLKNFWSEEEAETLKNSELVRKLFPGQEDYPILYNLPNIPRFPLKAEIERSFRTYKDEYIATRHALTYQGGNRKEAVHLTLSNTPLALKEAEPAASVWESFCDWLYSDYCRKFRPAQLTTFAKLTGKHPTIEDAFLYYHNQDIRLYPKENEANLAYYLSSEGDKHRRKLSHYGQVDIIHKGVQHNYNLKELDLRMTGREVCVIPDHSDATKAYIYLEFDEKRFDERVPDEGSVYLLGTGEDAYIRSLGDYMNIHKRKQNQKYQEKVISQAIGEHKQVQWENLSGPPLELKPADEITNYELRITNEEKEETLTLPSPEGEGEIEVTDEIYSPELKNLLKNL